MMCESLEEKRGPRTVLKEVVIGWQEEMLRSGTGDTSLTPCQESFPLTHPRGPRPFLLYDLLLEEAIGIVVLGNQKWLAEI